MRCDDVRAALSVALDGEDDALPAEDVRAHVAECADCADFEDTILGLRTQLRVEAVDGAPDVVDAVVRRVRALPTPPPVPIERRLGDGARPRGARLAWVSTALWAGRGAISTAAAIGFLAGAAYVGLGDDGHAPAAADLPERIVTAQTTVQALAADIQVVEYGRPDREGARRFAGRLVYGGPEDLQLTLTETARSRQGARGGGAPGDGDVRLRVDGDRWELDSVRGCMPAPGRASCPHGAARVLQAVTGRAPFSESAPVPLELVAPVESFALAGDPPSIGEREIAGREAVGVRATAAQVARFLEQLSPAGDLRAVHPTDPVELWLDRDDLVPLALDVFAAAGPVRERWAAAQGYHDEPGERVLAFVVDDVAINGDVDVDEEATTLAAGGAAGDRAGRESDAAADADGFTAFTTTGAEQHHTDEGFSPGDAPLVPVPDGLPAGFTPARSGTTRSSGGPAVQVRSWTDGRAWLKVEATADWEADHLFGGLGAAVRTVDLGAAGQGYLSADGRRVALHTDDLDVLVTGSLPTDELLDVAASLGLRGVAVPDDWREASATTLTLAAGRMPHLLTVAAAEGLDGFGRPAVRTLPDDTVTQVFAGPGDRGFVLTQR
ncbi:MAG TPA: zf-HC2 domain-containing protein, partial [Acidimicrobiales bacterium]